MTARRAILAALVGRRLTRAEICSETGLTVSTASACLTGLRQQPGRRVRVAEYRRDDVNGRVYLRPVYTLGNRPDCPRPSRAEVRRQSWLAYHYRHTRRAHVPASVFTLAQYL